MPHRQSIRTWTCTTCRAEFHYAPTIHVGVAFCCAGCAAGGPCICSYDDEPRWVRPRKPGDASSRSATTTRLYAAAMTTSSGDMAVSALVPAALALLRRRPRRPRSPGASLPPGRHWTTGSTSASWTAARTRARARGAHVRGERVFVPTSLGRSAVTRGSAAAAPWPRGAGTAADGPAVDDRARAADAADRAAHERRPLADPASSRPTSSAAPCSRPSSGTPSGCSAWWATSSTWPVSGPGRSGCSCAASTPASCRRRSIASVRPLVAGAAASRSSLGPCAGMGLRRPPAPRTGARQSRLERAAVLARGAQVDVRVGSTRDRFVAGPRPRARDLAGRQARLFDASSSAASDRIAAREGVGPRTADRARDRPGARRNDRGRQRGRGGQHVRVVVPADGPAEAEA